MSFNLDDLRNIGDIRNVWQNLNEKNWRGLFGAIQKVREEKGNNQTLDKLEQAGKGAESDGNDFPTNPADLAKLLHHQ